MQRFLGSASSGGPRWKSFRRELSDEQRRDLLGQLYAEGDDRPPFLRRFFILLSLSVLIAVMGLAADSGPVVIGAMLVSPLTTPLLGLSAALVMGWPRRQLEALLILIAGSAWAFVLAYAALELIPEPRTLTLQSQELLARTEPALLDLGVAVIAGAAGAYVLVRREAIGALPGVAIAVALVPPLSAVGMMAELGRAELAGDALLLYLTNLAGIVFAGSLVLLAAGMRPAAHDRRLARRAKLGLAMAGLMVLLVAYPLAAITRQTLASAADQDDAAALARDWAAGTELRIRSVNVTEDTVRVETSGPAPPPSTAPLGGELAGAFEEDVELTVAWTRETRIAVTGRGP